MKRYVLMGIGVAALLGACESNGRNGERNGATATDRPSTPPPGGSGAGEYKPMSSADARILSILHAKNLEEIEVGKLAQNKGVSDDVRSFGEMLERHHAENDAMVRSTANSAGLTLLEPRDINDALAREKGLSAAPSDPFQDLRALSGDAFDRAFAQKMLEGHREMIQMVQNARPTVKHASVRDLLDRTLPTLQEHEETAARLVNR